MAIFIPMRIEKKEKFEQLYKPQITAIYLNMSSSSSSCTLNNLPLSLSLSV
eukprot:c2799_g1_i1 orf=92-244(+)